MPDFYIPSPLRSYAILTVHWLFKENTHRSTENICLHFVLSLCWKKKLFYEGNEPNGEGFCDEIFTDHRGREKGTSVVTYRSYKKRVMKRSYRELNV